MKIFSFLMCLSAFSYKTDTWLHHISSNRFDYSPSINDTIIDYLPNLSFLSSENEFSEIQTKLEELQIYVAIDDENEIIFDFLMQSLATSQKNQLIKNINDRDEKTTLNEMLTAIIGGTDQKSILLQMVQTQIQKEIKTALKAKIEQRYHDFITHMQSKK